MKRKPKYRIVKVERFGEQTLYRIEEATPMLFGRLTYWRYVSNSYSPSEEDVRNKLAELINLGELVKETVLEVA